MMKQIKQIYLFILLLSLASIATPAQKRTPHFEDYPVADRFSGKAARVNLHSHPHAYKFRTMLREIAQKGPNFAGNYAVGYWGCGTECLRIGIVNLKTGRAYVSQFYASLGIAFRLGSRLLIVAPQEQIRDFYGNDTSTNRHPSYYILKRDALVLIYPKEDIGKEEIYWK